ncbi:hypothetical protein D4740_07670 [Actinomyces sp. 2119]|uniref:HTH cro/C1-type domain-containing protein n=1 Tax=Actinomyces lilanjuaniae TaxID=2321394 RepID=A0ABN5PLP9_9ACTO|nr:hypothetical protein D5R93_02190 [Actinomyces lilanjuaniae]RJF41933.1 hypothetical protein D4740_07670 [Actinomyces sp. 2119]
MIDILAARQKAAGVSQRRLAREAGMSLNRVGIIFRAEGPAPTVGELAVIAEVLELQSSEIIREAERRLRSRGADPQTHGAQAQPRAARTVGDRPEHAASRQWGDVGEESQLPHQE